MQLCSPWGAWNCLTGDGGMAAEAPQLVFNSGLWGGRQEGRSQNRMLLRPAPPSILCVGLLGSPCLSHSPQNNVPGAWTKWHHQALRSNMPTCYRILFPSLPGLGHPGGFISEGEFIPEGFLDSVQIPWASPNQTHSPRFPWMELWPMYLHVNGLSHFPDPRRWMLNVFTEGMEYFFQEVNKIIYFSLGALEKGKKNSLKQHVSCLIKFYYYYIWVCEKEKSISVLCRHSFIGSELKKSVWWITE